MRSLLLLLGLQTMPTPHLVLLTGIVGLTTVLLGWIADAIMGGRGFGVLANGALMLAGAILGVLSCRRLGYLPPPDQQAAIALIAGFSGIVLLTLLGAIRARLA